jgi:hypothetical protein
MNTWQVQSYRQPSQSHQQSVVVKRPVRPSQSGANSSRGRSREKLPNPRKGLPLNTRRGQGFIECGGRYATNE